MRVNRTYSISYTTITKLNDAISAKHRSRFVDKAILARLDDEDADIDWDGISSGNLMRKLSRREDISEFLRKAIQVELGQ